ncbi:hypothetical protein KZX46_21105 (plasmid) [Polymorphobacter sp. PAMC 29334]|uniref:hypothetical protein n=1 Tax=Polymorphobacter sp. PAMC 29334 TaxID=2862331 RepID=UPI001C74F400|nr:hypothetical protein [Polymorphobacter sp. PAMC 29334]QYE37014.1 hypothetical protein KZX46_21105 [Polymorphobacter sp. PAMC 29334]
MRKRIVTTVVLAWGLTACDPISGVKTEADLVGPVDLGCIDRVIRSIPDVGPVKRHTDRDESFQITPYRGKVVTVNGQATAKRLISMPSSP